MNASTQPDLQTSGISHWPDTDSIDARLKALIRQPIRPIRREHMDKVHGYFEQQCQGSKRLAEQAATTMNVASNVKLRTYCPSRETTSLPLAVLIFLPRCPSSEES